jgi:hypothetical protein
MASENTQTQEDWLYSPERLNLRTESLYLLLSTYGSDLKDDGSPEHSSEMIYNCAHDWVSQGNPTTEGLLMYFIDYYHD